MQNHPLPSPRARPPHTHALGRAECIATLVEQFERESGGSNGDASAHASTGSAGAPAAALSRSEEAALELSPLVSSASSAPAPLASGGFSSSRAVPFPRPSAYLVSHTRRFEVADLFSFFMGNRARIIYVSVLSGYMYGALWAYGTVFASSFAANVPVAFANGGHACAIMEHGRVNTACLGSFYTWLGVFALFSVPLACMELTEQVVMQVIMFAARLLVVVLMTGTVVGGWASCPAGSVVFAGLGGGAGSNSTSATGSIDGGGLPTTALFNTSGLSGLLPVATYAFIFHHSVPVLAHPVAKKSSLPSLFASAFAVCCLAYGALGLIVSLGFGDAINQQCNLNWKDYVGCVAAPLGDGAVPPEAASGLALAIRFVVLIFPALDVLSAYPLNAITLGNNLMAACCGSGSDSGSGSGSGGRASGGRGSDAGEAEEGSSSSSTGLTPSSLLSLCLPSVLNSSGGSGSGSGAPPPLALRTLFRLLAAVPPILAGALSTASGIDLDQILRWTGLIGVAIAFLIPSLLRAAAFARSKLVHKALAETPGGCTRAALATALSRPLTFAEVLLDAGGVEEERVCAGVRATPYTSWSVGGRALLWGVRGDGVMFFFALGMAGYVFWGLLTTA